MKVKCKSNKAINRNGELFGTYANITPGKIYGLAKPLEDEWHDTISISIIDDLGSTTSYYTYLFYTLDELRDNSINNILNEVNLL